MFGQILQIALLCVAIGSASIPISFTINSNPFVVWFGNALGSLFSAAVVIYIGNRMTSDHFRNRAKKHRATRKVVTVYEEGGDNKKVMKARVLIDKHGLKIFSLLCPIFPGVLVSTVAVYALNLDRHTYIRWMLVGVFFVSGAYVMSYWWVFVR